MAGRSRLMAETQVKKKPAVMREKRVALQFNHVMIYTTKLVLASKFYRDMLGFQVVDSYPGTYLRMKSPTGSTTIALHAVDPGQEMNSRTEDLRLYFEVEGLDAFCKTLHKKGVKFRQMPKDMPWGWRHAYLADPDGHEISLYWAGEARLKKTARQ